MHHVRSILSTATLIAFTLSASLGTSLHLIHPSGCAHSAKLIANGRIIEREPVAQCGLECGSNSCCGHATKNTESPSDPPHSRGRGANSDPSTHGGRSCPLDGHAACPICHFLTMAKQAQLMAPQLTVATPMVTRTIISVPCRVMAERGLAFAARAPPRAG